MTSTCTQRPTVFPPLTAPVKVPPVVPGRLLNTNDDGWRWSVSMITGHVSKLLGGNIRVVFSAGLQLLCVRLDRNRLRSGANLQRNINGHSSAHRHTNLLDRGLLESALGAVDVVRPGRQVRNPICAAAGAGCRV